MNLYGITKNIIVPNVTILSGLVRFETDMLILSKSGYATAIEIKVSKADLKNDLKKNHIKRLNSNWRSSTGKKAEEFYYKNIKHFYYAVPECLADYAKTQIPDFCGLLVASKHEFYDKERISFLNDFGKAPKLLFKTKWTIENQLKLARLGAMRILKYKNKLLNP